MLQNGAEAEKKADPETVREFIKGLEIEVCGR